MHRLLNSDTIQMADSTEENILTNRPVGKSQFRKILYTAHCRANLRDPRACCIREENELYITMLLITATHKVFIGNQGTTHISLNHLYKVRNDVFPLLMCMLRLDTGEI